MYDLLSDTTTYEKKYKGHATIEGEKFKKEARRILVKSNRGSVSKAHLKNSNDLIERIRDTDLSQKRLVSYDVTSLFTNVSIEGALEAAKEVVNGMNDEDLPLSKGDYLKLISLCVKFGSFIFNNEEYFQCRGLAMRSPLSCVLASLYMEVLERDHFTNIMGQDTTWLWYVDDVLAITPRETDLSNKLNMLNRIESNIQFTMEQEESDKLAFLDTEPYYYCILQTGIN
ncbi:telomerase reverse transcriptase-like [Oratosquilla oratoria]|uniref:telomerase reverse transcriptase-like n=1 Tax=Oratosquilla oratoria TaxID=337810 RepID=UPI003F75C29A